VKLIRPSIETENGPWHWLEDQFKRAKEESKQNNIPTTEKKKPTILILKRSASWNFRNGQNYGKGERDA